MQRPHRPTSGISWMLKDDGRRTPSAPSLQEKSKSALNQFDPKAGYVVFPQDKDASEFELPIANVVASNI